MSAIAPSDSGQSMTGIDDEDEHAAEKASINPLYQDIPVIVEGPHSEQDHTFFLIHKNEDLQEMEKGMNVDDFKSLWRQRSTDTEFKILTRVCSTMVHFNCLH